MRDLFNICNFYQYYKEEELIPKKVEPLEDMKSVNYLIHSIKLLLDSNCSNHRSNNSTKQVPTLPCAAI